MKSSLKVLLVVILSLSFTAILYGNNGVKTDNKTTEVKTVPGKFIVKFKATDNNGTRASFSKLSAVAARYNTKKQKEVFSEAKNEKIKKILNLQNVIEFETDKSADIQKIVKELNQNPEVEYAEPVYLSKIESVPNDPLYSSQYQFPQISAPAAWDIQPGSADVIIGVIDSGVDWDHEDLEANIWTNTDEIPDNGIDDDNNGYIDDVRGWDFVTGVSGTEDWQAAPGEDGDTTDNNPMDFGGHGTHVAGISGAVTNNGLGVASASAGAQIMPLRCGYEANDGNGYIAFPVEAYIYAADNGADITNQSSQNSGQAIIDAAYYAFLNGVLIVESAGNGNAVTPSALGGQDWVISVASVKQSDEKASYSSYGDYVSVSAPGGDFNPGILSTFLYPSDFFGGEKYGYLNGTSMAAPLVASAAALIKSHEPSISVIDLFTRIVGTADNIDAVNPNYEGLLGTGRINLQRALTETVNATPNFKIISSVIDDASGNGNGQLDAGEQVELTVTLRNVWDIATNVNAELTTDQAWPVSVVNGAVSLGTVTGILDTTSWETEAVFRISASADAIPISNQFQIEITDGSYSQTLNLNIAISPQILFVADFAQSNNASLDHSQIYFDSFEKNHISYNYVHHMDTEITEELLSQYPIVVWGCEWYFPSVDSVDREILQTYLDNGGALFLSGQDVAWDLNDNPDNMDADFLNNYLKVNFLADVSGYDEIFGLENDPITEGLDIEFYQPKRDADNQYPDVIEPRDGSVSILNYEDGRSGAIRYNGVYDLVFFGFGGFEAITNEDMRNTVMNNTVNWFSGIDYSLAKLKDTESTTENYNVSFYAESRSSTISTVELYWDIDGQLPFNKVVMSDSGGGYYAAEIPAQSEGSDVEYFVFSKAADDKYVVSEVNSFHVGVDTEVPVIEVLSKPLSNSINLYGPAPYKLKATFSDNIGIDTTTAKIFYTVNDFKPYESNQLSAEGGIFESSFEFAQPLQVGDKVSYYFEVVDNSSNLNKSASDVYNYFIDTLQVIDDFEEGLSEWDLEGTWGLATDRRKQGAYALTDSPEGFYASSIDISANYLPSFNLTPYKYAGIDFYLRSNLESNKDSLFAEISNDGGLSWNPEFIYSRNSISFKLHKIDLTKYTGSGNDDVRLRFRLMTDAQGERNGTWIDSVSIVVSFDVVGVENEIIQQPKEFSLEQNYPNPFNPSTKISYALPTESRVKIQIFNILGEVVATIVNQVITAGSHSVEWNASNLSSGVYLYRISAESASDSKQFNSVKKMILMK